MSGVVNGVIFDMDGVLLDTHPAHLQAWRCVLTEAGRSASDSELQFVLDGHKRRDILHHFLGDMDDSRAAYYGRRKDEYFWRFSDSVRPLPGLIDFVDELRRVRLSLAVGTSAGQARTEVLLAKFGLDSRFTTVVTGDAVRNGKPDPSIYLLAVARMQLSPESVVVIEDAVSGVQAARAAGMNCLGVAHNGRAKCLLEAGARLVISDFHELSVAKLRRTFECLSPTGNLED